MAFTFTEPNDGIDFSGHPDLNASEFTFFMRVRPENVTNNQVRAFWYWEDGTTTQSLYMGFTSSGFINNRLQCGFYDGSSYENTLWTTGWGANEDHTFAFVWDGTTQSIFADGDTTAKATNTPGGGNPNTGSGIDNTIGHTRTGASQAECDFEDCAYFDRALSGEECAALDAGFSPLHFVRDLKIYCPFTENTNEVMVPCGITESGSPAVATAFRRMEIPPLQIGLGTAPAPGGSVAPQFHHHRHHNLAA